MLLTNRFNHTAVLVSEALSMSGEDFVFSMGSFTKDVRGRSLCLKAAQWLMDETVFVDFPGRLDGAF